VHDQEKGFNNNTWKKFKIIVVNVVVQGIISNYVNIFLDYLDEKACQE